MKFPVDFYEYLINNTLIEIKGGIEREKFLQIWMVEVNNRVFARSWNKSEKSWFTEIERTGIGQIKYGNQIIQINGSRLSNESNIHELINQRYLARYYQAENQFYSRGITKSEYKNYTMEFFFEGKVNQ